MLTWLRYWRDGQTDRQTAFQLYIVEDVHIPIPYSISFTSALFTFLIAYSSYHLKIPTVFQYNHRYSTSNLEGSTIHM